MGSRSIRLIGALCILLTIPPVGARAPTILPDADGRTPLDAPTDGRACHGPHIELGVGVGCDFSGFFTEALGLHVALAARGTCVRTPTLSRCEPALRGLLTPHEREAASTAGRFQDDASQPDVDVRWHNGEDAPCPWERDSVREAEARGTLAVLRSMTEKVVLSDTLRRCCALVHETWVPTEWHRKLYRREGCPNARALPEAVDDRIFRGKIPGDGDSVRSDSGADSGASLRDSKKTVFLSVFQWQHRKGPDALLKAYWNAFDAKDDVVLRIRAKVPGWAHNPFRTANDGVKHWARALWNTSPTKLAAVEVIEVKDGEDVTREQMASMYRSAHAFVLPSRGEGWCLPCAEAMASGTLLIASDFSGTTAFADSTNSLPVHCAVINAQKGCEPDVEGLAWRLRWTHDHRAEAAALGTKGADDIRVKFGMSAVATLWAEEGRRGLGRFDARRLVDVD